MSKILDVQEIKNYFASYYSNRETDTSWRLSFAQMLFFVVFIRTILSFIRLDTMQFAELIPANLGNSLWVYIEVYVIVALFFILFVCSYLIYTRVTWCTKYFISILISLPLFINRPFFQEWHLPIFIALFLLLLPWLHRNWSHPEWWTLSTIFVIVTIFPLGLSVIDGIYGVPNTISLNETDYKNISIKIPESNITCKDINGTLIVNNTIYCRINPPLENVTAYARFLFSNGSSSPIRMDNLTFNIQEKNESSGLEPNGTINGERSICTSAEGTVKSTAEQAYYEQKDKFVSYLFGLVGLLIFSVPILITYIHQIFEFDNRKSD